MTLLAVVTDAFAIPALLAVLGGGVNCVPHGQADGRLLNIFGNSHPTELPPENDRDPLREDHEAVARLCREPADAHTVG